MSFHWKNRQLPQRTLQESRVACACCQALLLSISPVFGMSCLHLVAAPCKRWDQNPPSSRPNKPCDLNAALAVAGFLSLHAFGLHQLQLSHDAPNAPGRPCALTGRLWHGQCQHSYTQKGWSHNAGTCCCREMMALDHVLKKGIQRQISNWMSGLMGRWTSCLIPHLYCQC